MRKIGWPLALILLAVFTAHAEVNGVTAELALAQDQYLPDEDLQLRVRIINRSGQEITLGSDNDWISFSIQGEDNFVSPKLSEMPVKEQFTVQSGEMATRALNPTPYFDFRKPGLYHISARIKIPQWNQEIVCKPVGFTVANGVPLPNLANLQFGVAPPNGDTNALPEVRRYSLLKVSYVNVLKLYFRLTDNSGRTLRVFPLAPMTSFTDPEAQIDRNNNLHVLLQTGAHSFTYAVMGTDGRMLARQTHEYTNTRPVLRVSPDGQIFVAGGMRRFSRMDVPPSIPESADRQ